MIAYSLVFTYLLAISVIFSNSPLAANLFNSPPMPIASTPLANHSLALFKLILTVFIALKHHRKKMPNLGLMGFDNMEWVNFSSPSVTTIVQPAFEEGLEAAKIVIDQIEGKGEVPGQQVLDCYVNWNESTL